ncbi:MAG: P-II family nitrogen regulator, partial [Thaumarchaeota archaeon]|nr:P-II family nitrogen regulator [Nitrososphaerota archaeon]
MKKIEAIIQEKHEQNVVDALRKLDIGGMSLFHGEGRGRGPRKIKPGLGRHIERYNAFLEIVIVVEDSKVD